LSEIGEGATAVKLTAATERENLLPVADCERLRDSRSNSSVKWEIQFSVKMLRINSQQTPRRSTLGQPGGRHGVIFQLTIYWPAVCVPTNC
jgi:hypothetical protein